MLAYLWEKPPLRCRAAPWGSPRVELGHYHDSQGVEVVEDLKMNEQCGNVYENKGPLWKTGAEAGMSMKTDVLSPSRP